MFLGAWSCRIHGEKNEQLRGMKGGVYVARLGGWEERVEEKGIIRKEKRGKKGIAGEGKRWYLR